VLATLIQISVLCVCLSVCLSDCLSVCYLFQIIAVPPYLDSRFLAFRGNCNEQSKTSKTHAATDTVAGSEDIPLVSVLLHISPSIRYLY
jgi:hypothetical protein